MTGASATGASATGAIHPQRVLAVRCPDWSCPDWSRPDRSRPDRNGQDRQERQDRQEPDPQARAFEQVVDALQKICPHVEVLRPGLAAFAADGPAGYFGGEAALARHTVEAVAGLGFGCGAGIADGMFAALLASRDGLNGAQPAGQPVVIVPPGGTPAFLAPRPVTVLGVPDLAGLLIRLGVRTLGELAALPAARAADRFGAPGLLAHRLASGLDPRPLVVRPPSADLSVRTEFDPPAERSEQVVFAAKALAGQLHAGLAAAGLACVRVQVQISRDDGAGIVRLWRHDGLLTDLAVAERVRWQLDGWQAGRPPGDPALADQEARAGGVASLRLAPDQLVRDHGLQLGLWGDALVSDRVARAALRVQALLGHGAVTQPVLSGGRGPAEQALLVPFGDTQPAGQPGPRPVGRPWPGRIPPPAPATVYPEPRPAAVTDGSGSPVTVTGRGYVSADPVRLSVAGGPAIAITAWTGPWPVTERWWDPERACRKARFQLVTADGAAWLAAVMDGRWLIEASYD